MFIDINREIKKTMFYYVKDYEKLLKKLKRYGKKYNKCYIIMLCYLGLQYTMLNEYINNSPVEPLKSSLDLIDEIQTHMIEMINILDDAKRNPNNYVIGDDEFKKKKKYLENYVSELEKNVDEMARKKEEKRRKDKRK